MEEKTYNLELTETELTILNDIFDEITKDSLHEWTRYVDEGKVKTEECFGQWVATHHYNAIREKSENLLNKIKEDTQ